MTLWGRHYYYSQNATARLRAWWRLDGSQSSPSKIQSQCLPHSLVCCSELWVSKRQTGPKVTQSIWGFLKGFSNPQVHNWLISGIHQEITHIKKPVGFAVQTILQYGKNTNRELHLGACDRLNRNCYGRDRNFGEIIISTIENKRNIGKLFFLSCLVGMCPGLSISNCTLWRFSDMEQKDTDLMHLLWVKLSCGSLRLSQYILNLKTAPVFSPSGVQLHSAFFFSLTLFTERKCVTFLDEQTAKGV